jgi:hypothetical protein
MKVQVPSEESVADDDFSTGLEDVQLRLEQILLRVLGDPTDSWRSAKLQLVRVALGSALGLVQDIELSKLWERASNEDRVELRMFLRRRADPPLASDEEANAWIDAVRGDFRSSFAPNVRDAIGILLLEESVRETSARSQRATHLLGVLNIVDVPFRARKYLSAAGRLYIDGHDAPTIVFVGAALEAALEERLEALQEHKLTNGDFNLKAAIDLASNRQILTARATDAAHDIRRARNDVAHADLEARESSDAFKVIKHLQLIFRELFAQ